MGVPIVRQETEVVTPTKNDLLSRYASKQAKLMEVEKQAETLRFELLELQAQLHLEINRDHPLDIRARANVEVNSLKKKVSTMFQNGSPVRTPVRESAELETIKKPMAIFPNQELVKKKASMVFNNKFIADVRGRMDQQQAEIDKIAKKGSDFAKNLFTSLSPKKSGPVDDTSFLFDSVAETSMVNKSILLSEDDTVEHSMLDIDEYSSSEE